eukprot:GEMP01035049.1.p1 GENE.GEMP01035049.1~~GEMP01035049.1.p1  ORF type:complete len:490 (+),score=117.75 GEMP01035049.1:140-1609(+)
MVEPGQLQMFNKPDAHEVFTLPHGVAKHVEYIPDPKMENAGTYILWLEDHTLGNALRMQLLRNQHVLFAGYRVPHPLINNLEIKVQTTENSSPGEAMKLAYQELIQETKDILLQFQTQMTERGVAGFTAAAEIADAPARDDDDEPTSHRFSEVSATECAGDESPLEGGLPQLQDESWVQGYNELEEKLRSYASASNKPIFFPDPLCVQDIAKPVQVVDEVSVAEAGDTASSPRPPSDYTMLTPDVRVDSGAVDSGNAEIDSGDFVCPADEGETPVMSHDPVMSETPAYSPMDNVSSAAVSSQGFGEFSEFIPTESEAHPKRRESSSSRAVYSFSEIPLSTVSTSRTTGLAARRSRRHGATADSSVSCIYESPSASQVAVAAASASAHTPRTVASSEAVAPSSGAAAASSDAVAPSSDRPYSSRVYSNSEIFITDIGAPSTAVSLPADSEGQYVPTQPSRPRSTPVEEVTADATTMPFSDDEESDLLDDV